MSTVSLLAIICICIEIWHLFYANHLYEKYFKRIEDVIKWGESYSNLNKYFMEFSDYYLHNPDLQNHLGLHLSTPMLGIINILQDVGGASTGRRKILQLCSMKQLSLFLLQQGIEMLYWIIVFAMAIIVPGNTGILIFMFSWIISTLQKHLNKNKKLIWINADCAFCITFFSLIAYIFYSF